MANLPEHVDMSEAGPVCRHCGGMVGEDGLAEEVAELATTSNPEPVTDDKSAMEQAFADSINRERR